MLTFWADSLIDRDKKPRELNVLSHGQCDLWDNHPACLEKKVICAHTPSPAHRASLFCTQQDEWPLPESRGGQGLSILLEMEAASEPRSLHLNLEEKPALLPIFSPAPARLPSVTIQKAL